MAVSLTRRVLRLRRHPCGMATAFPIRPPDCERLRLGWIRSHSLMI